MYINKYKKCIIGIICTSLIGPNITTNISYAKKSQTQVQTTITRGNIYIVTKDSNVYKKPSNSGKKIARLTKGTLVNLKEGTSTWSKIQYEGKEGYIKSSMLKKHYEVKPGEVTIKYIDNTTKKEIIESEVHKGLELDKYYTYEYKQIEGYEYINISNSKVSVKLTEENPTTTITFEYKKLGDNTPEIPSTPETPQVKPEVPESVNMDEMPYIATVYTNPDLDINEDVILKFYATDFNHSAYLNDNYDEKFEIIFNLNGKITKMTRNVGESTINLGKIQEGEYWYTIQAVDQYGRKSAEIFGEFRVEDKAKKEALIKENTHYVTEEELAQYGISKDNSSEKAHETKVGLQNLLNDLANKGVRKCVLPKGTYRIDSEYIGTDVQRVKNVIKIPSNFILDLNGSTLKQDTTPHEQDKAYMISIDGAYDAHVTNGIIEGDYGERDLSKKENGYPSGEQVGCGILAGESKYSSFNNLIVRKFPGYAMSVGLGLDSKHAVFAKNGLSGWDAIEIDENGNEIKSNNKFTSDFSDLSPLKDIDTIRTGKYLGYQFNQDGDEWVVKYHFYDENKNYIKTTIGHQYRPFIKPENAAYLRATYISSDVSKLQDLKVYHMYTPVNSTIRDIAFEDTRTCALNPNQGNNILIENCTFTRTATNITPVAIDFEDGWNLMQDYCLRNNEVLVPVGTADIVVVGGMNLQFENNKNFRFGTRSTTPGIVFRNNEDCSGGIAVSNRVQTGYYRFYNNKNQKSASGGSENLKFKVYDCTFNEVAASASKYTEFVRCEFDWNNKVLQYNTGGIISGNFKDCVLKNYVEPSDFIHSSDAYFENCKIENMSVKVQNAIEFKNCDINNLKITNWSIDMNIKIKDCNINNLKFNTILHMKSNMDLLLENNNIDNSKGERLNILDDAIEKYNIAYPSDKIYNYNITTKNNNYKNGTFLANENVFKNETIKFSISD